ncbi:MAG: DUF1028 domain-containing protein [Candidatus Bathyarchaeota archaeon]|nr:DUF1028 domain-containing protein [Candidatus Bathyarchaeota archaeon]
MKRKHKTGYISSRNQKIRAASQLRHILLKWNRCFGTFSILALDPLTKDLGIAVQSRAFSVGSMVPWAKAEVGGVVTQSFVNVSYGPRGLQMLREGLHPEVIVETLTRQDEAREYRQLGVMDSKGNVASFTGRNCLMWAGSRIGKNYLAIGNILEGKEVVDSMGRGFESAEDDLAGKLIAALEGGEEAGGDIRGRQSASLVVVRKRGGRDGWGDRYVDLRVEDHPNPICELKRLLQLSRVYHLIDESEDKITSGNIESALATIRKALLMNSNIDEAHINLAIILMKLGRKEEALPEFREAIRINPKARRLIWQLAHSGIIDSDWEYLAKLELSKKNRRM